MKTTRRSALAALAGGTFAMAQSRDEVKRYVRFEHQGRTSFGRLEGEYIREIRGNLLGSRAETGTTVKLEDVKLRYPIEPSKVLAVGLNYKSHIGNRPVPKQPEIFYKPITALQDPGGPIVIPPGSKDLHYEAEFVIVMGQRAAAVSVADAPSHILGYTCGNDVSDRNWQNGTIDKTPDLQWWRAKGSDTFAPLGPCIAVGLDYRKSRIKLRLSGEVKQDQVVSDLLFGPPEIVSFISKYVTLEAGDVIYTGTPGSTSAMKAGDKVEVEVDGIGVLKNHVVASERSRLMDRRSFLSTTAAAAVSGPAAAANDRVELAVIGVRGQGRALARRFAGFGDVHVRCLCDVDERVYARAAGEVEKACGHRPEYVKDLRAVLDNPAVDAVAIASPDHWHAPATILACDAGKDVYVEKPASHNLREGRLMVEAARRNDRVVQLGIQSRSRPSTLAAIELVRSGKIGQVLMAKAWDVQLRDDIGHVEDSSPPPEVDFETWTGPAPMLPFNENRFHYKWHWNWNYGTGDMGNDGVHQLDIARWAIGAGSPVRVSGMGRKVFFQDDQQTPDTMNVTFDFGDKLIQFELRIWNPYGMNEQANGVAVYGTEGMIHIGRWPRQWGYRLYARQGKLVEDTSKTSTDPGDAHPRNFIDCVKSRKKPNAEIEIGHRSSSLCHLGNIVTRTGRNIEFDAAKERIVGDQSAHAMLKRAYRNHWSVPKGV